jgi:RNA polymerase sigma-70 factor (ECF subfamily)
MDHPGCPDRPLSSRPLPTVDELLRRHGAELYRLALRLTRNESDARDLVQDTYERSLRNLPTGVSQDRALRWLVVTLRHRFLDLRRAKDCRGRVQLDDVAWVMMPDRDPEPEPAWANIESNQVWLCVERLKPAQREVFLLRERDRLPHAEIARRLRVPRTTAVTRFLRSLKRLRQLLEQELGRSGIRDRPQA